MGLLCSVFGSIAQIAAEILFVVLFFVSCDAEFIDAFVADAASPDGFGRTVLEQKDWSVKLDWRRIAAWILRFRN